VRSAASSGVRLAELVATISLGTDLGLGQSMEHILRQTLVSLRMAELLAFDEAEREVAYFSGLLAWVGCHTDAYEQTKWFGDDIALKRDGYHYDMGRPVDLLAFAWHTVGRGRPPLEDSRRGWSSRWRYAEAQWWTFATIGWPRTSWPAASASANRYGAVSRKASPLLKKSSRRRGWR
jgi:hypothetical protein